MNFKIIFISIVLYYFKQSKTTKHNLGKKSVFPECGYFNCVNTMKFISWPLSFLVFRWPFFNWFYLLSKWHFNRGIHFHFHSPLTFLWLRVQEAVCQRLARLMLGGKKKKTLQIADVSFLLVEPITLKNWHCLKTDFRCSVFLAARVNVLPK